MNADSDVLVSPILDSAMRGKAALPLAAAPAAALGPFNGYTRHLTPRGGILIGYWDQDRNPPLTATRIVAWISSSGLVAWWLLYHSCLPLGWALITLGLVGYGIHRLVRRRFLTHHFIEIHPQGLILDDEDFFDIEDIGENWPQPQMIDDNPDRIVVSGICGTRFIEYATANRIDKNDRTPEILAEDLMNAMEQLWGRRDAIVAIEDDLD